MLIRSDCRHYRLDRPCVPHKERGVKCDGCGEYDPVEYRILLIKLGAMGDVLRTTALLPAIKARHARPQLTWLVCPKPREVLQGLTDIDRLWVLDASTLPQLQVEHFDWVINLDLSAESLALATLAQAERKSGYGLSAQGTVRCWNPEAEPYLAMSYWDDLKKQNTKTYQQLMLDILGSEDVPGEVQVLIPPAEREYAREFFKEHRMKPNRPVVGLNLGAGGRWRWKRWTPGGFLELARRLWEAHQANLLMLSGPDEAESKADWLRQCDIPVVDGGHNNPYARFAALVNLCDVVVTGDTMALHLALALRKNVVALLGPTSRAEVELYGRGVALSGEVPCLCCYLPDCEVHPSCMESLHSDTVFSAVEQFLGQKERVST